jgi:peptidoglycan-associated lipoprotein
MWIKLKVFSLWRSLQHGPKYLTTLAVLKNDVRIPTEVSTVRVHTLFVKSLMTAGLVLALGACGSKKTDTDANAAGSDANSQSPSISNEAMTFAAEGSDSGKIAGLQTVNFEYDKAALTNDARKKLQGNVDWLKARANVGLQVEGHCDSRGSIEYNLSLGERRAQAVKNYMVSLGVAGDRLSVISYGKEKPLVDGDSEADHVKNRRANFLPLNR